MIYLLSFLLITGLIISLLILNYCMLILSEVDFTGDETIWEV